jgi:IS5 family transposase
MLGDKAYDSAELRDELHERKTKPVIPNRSNRQQEAAVQLQQASLQASAARRECLQQVEGLQAHCNAIRQTRTKLASLCLPGRRT